MTTPRTPTTTKAGWNFASGDEISSDLVALRRLGGGSAFEVYLAIHETMAATVVAKVIRPDQVAERRVLRAIERERDALRALEHPMIVRMFGAVVDGERPHLVLEHVEGPTLSTLVKKYGPLQPEQVVPLALSLASALHFMAARGYCHLDVKPSNVIMSAPPRLIDLSVARTVERAAALEGRVGTRRYMAPEQVEPDGRVGPPADVWGLGVTLHRAISGSNAFTSGDGTHPQLAADPAPLPPTVPAPLRDVVSACLRRDPAERPTASEVAAMLEPASAAMPRLPRLRPRRPR